MVARVLSGDQEELLHEERRLLGDLRAALVKFGASDESQDTLVQSIGQLDELFLLVVVGEFNSGKSAFINALLGRRVVEEGVTPTTSRVHILRYGENNSRGVVTDRLHTIAAPVDLLREMHIVDTPGTNAIIREHEEITADFVPRSDFVLFVTSADRPFTETERAFLEQLRDWGKKVVIVLNKVDILERQEEIDQIQAFVAEHATRLLGTRPEIFPVSAKQAFRAKQGEPALWQVSRFEPLERHLVETLDDTSRVRLKLMNPLGVGCRLAARYLDLTLGRLALVNEDAAMLDDVERQVALYKDDMSRDFALRMIEIEKILLQMDQRGQDFFDETMRLGRVFDLLNKSRIQQGFEQQVVSDAPQQIERRVGGIIDWLVDAEFRQWQRVTGYLAERQRQYADRIVDAEAQGFYYDRTRLIESVGKDAQRVVDTYDRRREAQALADGARNAVAAAAAVGAGALGLGTLVTVAATTAAADITGLVMASVVAAVGFFIIPAKRRRAKDEMREKVSALRDALARALRLQFEREMDRSAERMSDAIAPYSRFVRSEHAKLTETAGALSALVTAMESLSARIATMA